MTDEVAKPDRLWTAANLLTLGRFLLAPALLALAYLGLERAFTAALAVALATDVVDGRLARWRGQASLRGARLDSWADLATYAVVPLCVYWMRPDLLETEGVTFWAIVAALAVPVTYGFIKYGRLTTYHTRAAVVAAFLFGSAVIFLFAGGPAWPLRVAAAILVAAELEEIAITAVLPRPVTLVRSLPAALRIRREQFADEEE